MQATSSRLHATETSHGVLNYQTGIFATGTSREFSCSDHIFRKSMIYKIRRIPLTSWIIISMIVGVLIGTFAPDFAMTLKPVSTVFLRMIKSIIVPLIFGTLVVGIAGHGDDMKRVSRSSRSSTSRS
jgi:predicted permease